MISKHVDKFETLMTNFKRDLNFVPIRQFVLFLAVLENSVLPMG